MEEQYGEFQTYQAVEGVLIVERKDPLSVAPLTQEVQYVAEEFVLMHDLSA